MSEKILNLFLLSALKCRRIALGVTVILTCVAGYFAGQIGLDMKWISLLPESDPIVQEWIKVMDEYPLGANYIITVKSDSTAKVEAAADRIIDRIESLDEVVTTTYGKVPENFLVERGLMGTKPKDLRRAVDVFSDVRLVPYLTHLNNDFEREFSGDADRVKDQERELVGMLGALEEFVDLIDQAIEGTKTDDVMLSRVVRDLSSGNPYYLSLDRKMGIIPVAVKASVTDFGRSIEVDGVIRKEIEALNAALPDVDIGTTGMIPAGRDEMESLGPYTVALTLLSVVLIFAVLVWNYRSIIIPILGLTPIVIGVIWAVGFYRLTVGDLNILTAMIMLVLIGLGIAFSIHMITRFYEERAAGHSLEKTLHKSVVVTGKAVLTGAMTSAMAFFALMVGDTRGIVQFGFCAGSGLIITLISIFYILPPLLVWRDNRLSRIGERVASRDFDVLGSVAHKAATKRKTVFLAILALAVVATLQIRTLEYEYNILELQPEGLESLDLQQEIIDRYKLSAEVAFTTVNSVEEARKIAKSLKKKSVVGDVDSIEQWIPAPEWVERNKESIGRLRNHLEQGRHLQPDSFAVNATQREFYNQLERLLFNIVEIEELSFIGGQDRVVSATERLTGGESGKGALPDLISRFDSGNVDWNRIGEVATGFSGLLRDRLLMMVKYDDAVTEEMLPEKLLTLYKNQDSGRYLVQIYPRKNLYVHEALLRFVNSVNTVSSKIAGMPKIILLINDAMVNDGAKALLASSLVIILLLVFDLRNVTAALIAMIPMVFGAFWMVAMMAFLDIKLNFVNVIAVPVIIGIGIDNGIHILHRWRQEGIGGVRKATAKVGHAILMTCITTMIGFGSISFYTHRGTASLGNVLFIGVGFCFISTILILPLLGSFVEARIMKRFGSNQGLPDLSPENQSKA